MALRWAVGIVVAVALVASVVVSFWPSPGAASASVTGKPADAQPMIVRDVVTGDTVRLEVGFPGTQVQSVGRLDVRLIGINLPSFGDQAGCYADDAKNRLAELLPAGSIAWGALDVESRADDGFWLMYLWTADGRFVNYELADDGFVIAQRQTPNDRFAKEIAAAQTHAVARLWGLWGECGL